jgi:hypothetical protein
MTVNEIARQEGHGRHAHYERDAMHTIDINAGDYAGTFNVREERDGTMRVSAFTKPNGGRAYPRTRSAAHTTDCLVTRADGSQYRIAKGTRKGASARKPRTTTTVARVAPEAARVVSSYDARHAERY